MKKIRNLCLVLIGMIALMGYKCDNDINPDTTYAYKGKIMSQDCPSRVEIQVLNQNIGDTVKLNDTVYYNIIVIMNNPGNIKNGHTIYFNIDQSSSPDKCGFRSPCPDMLYQSDGIKTRVCMSTYCTTNCGQNAN